MLALSHFDWQGDPSLSEVADFCDLEASRPGLVSGGEGEIDPSLPPQSAVAELQG